jgi:NAD(P)-dependent dehydrogenase (short-subunit alcohol dehydrogenase family)
MRAEDLFDIKGAAAIVTGAASGIGLACARVLAANGARVALLDKDADGLQRAERQMMPEGSVVRRYQADVTNRTELDHAFDAVAQAFGRIDIVFANAGIGGGPGFLGLDGARRPGGAFEHISDERWDVTIDHHLSSVFWTIQASARHMKATGGGRIIVTTSIAGLKTEAVVGAPYVAVKAAAAHLVRQSALELARYDIQVNAIAPGPFLTNISGGRMHDAAVRGHHERVVPLKRMAEADEIMGLALFLASPSAKYMTGAQVVIDGGATLGFAD